MAQWYEKQLRFLQTVLREPDVVDYDAEGVVSYMRSIRANVLVINAGGIVDFFKHELPTANPNPFLTNDHFLKDITDACHRQGIKVVVRVDFRGVDKRIYELRPDWFAVDADGGPMFYTSNTIPNPLYRPCYTGYYRNEYAYAYMEMLLERFDIDGIWENSYHEHGICYCKRCATEYKRMFGEELPRGGHFHDDRYDRYRQFKEHYYKKHLADSKAVVKKYGEDKVFCSEAFGLYYESYRDNSANLYNIRDTFDFLVTPMFVANHHALHSPSSLIKFLKSITLEKTPVMLFCHLGMNNELRYVASPAAETRIWMWQAVSSGGSLWNTVFVGQHADRTHDRRNAYLCQDVYAYMEANEDVLAHQKPVADVSIYYSMKTSQRFGKGSREQDGYITHLIGTELALLDRKLQYDFINDRELRLDALKDVKVLVVPNAACLSDEEAEVLRAYVAGGGKLIATYRTSLLRPDGSEREDFALADVFGCSFTGIVKDGSHYGYQYIRDAAHPIVAGMERTEMLANWGPNLLVRPASEADAQAPITYVPQIYPQSPERAWLRSLETEYPTVIVNRFGKGTSVFFPYEIDRQIVMHGHPDFKTLLGNALQSALEGEQRIASQAPSSIQFTLNRDPRQPGRYMLHIVNMTSAPARPVVETIPYKGLEAELVLEGKGLERFSILRGDAGIRATPTAPPSDGQTKIKLDIPVVDDYVGLLFEMKE